MIIDHSDEVGWPATASEVRKEPTQQQKAARAVNSMLAARAAGRAQHPYFRLCVCDWCVLRRKVAAE